MRGAASVNSPAWTSPDFNPPSAIPTSNATRRGRDGTFRWFVEEVGELAKAFRSRESATTSSTRLGDVLALAHFAREPRGRVLARSDRALLERLPALWRIP